MCTHRSMYMYTYMQSNGIRVHIHTRTYIGTFKTYISQRYIHNHTYTYMWNMTPFEFCFSGIALPVSQVNSESGICLPGSYTPGFRIPGHGMCDQCASVRSDVETCEYMFICIHAHMHACAYSYMHTYIRVHMHICAYAHMYSMRD